MRDMEYRREKARIIQRMRELLDRADAEGRGLDGTEKEEFSRLEARALELDEMIQHEEFVRAAELELERPMREVPDAVAVTEERTDPRGTDEYRRSFVDWVRSGKRQIESRDLFRGSGPAGGYLIPTALEARIIELASQASLMRQLGTVVAASTDAQIPVEASLPAFSYIAEKGSYGETSPTLNQVTLSAHKVGGVIKVSEELLADSAVDIEAYLASACARAIAQVENESFFVGDGNAKPRGVILDAQVGVTTASSTAIAFDEIIRMPFTLDDTYLSRAVFVMSPSTALAIASLRDASGSYYWPLAEQLTRPRTLLGYPVYVVNSMPGIAAGNVVAVFGDMSFYRVQDRMGITIQKLVELYAGTGQVGFRVTVRHDGALLLPEAVKSLKMANA